MFKKLVCQWVKECIYWLICEVLNVKKQLKISPAVYFRYPSISPATLLALRFPRTLRQYQYSVRYLADLLLANSGQAEKQTIVKMRINRNYG